MSSQQLLRPKHLDAAEMSMKKEKKTRCMAVHPVSATIACTERGSALSKKITFNHVIKDCTIAHAPTEVMWAA